MQPEVSMDKYSNQLLELPGLSFPQQTPGCKTVFIFFIQFDINLASCHRNSSLSHKNGEQLLPFLLTSLWKHTLRRMNWAGFSNSHTCLAVFQEWGPVLGKRKSLWSLADNRSSSGLQSGRDFSVHFGLMLLTYSIVLCHQGMITTILNAHRSILYHWSLCSYVRPF